MGVIQAVVIEGGKVIKVSVNLNSTQKTFLHCWEGMQKLLRDELKVRNVG